MSDNTFTLFAVFRLSSSHPIVLDGRDVPGVVQELDDVTSLIADENVTVRGWYDVSGMRVDADIMLCLQGSEVEDLQWSLRELRRTTLLKPLIRSWGTIGIDDGDRLLGDEASLWIAVRPSGPLEYPVVHEADEAAGLFDALGDDEFSDAGYATQRKATAYVGRLVESVELVEILQ